MPRSIVLSDEVMEFRFSRGRKQRQARPKRMQATKMGSIPFKVEPMRVNENPQIRVVRIRAIMLGIQPIADEARVLVHSADVVILFRPLRPPGNMEAIG